MLVGRDRELVRLAERLAAGAPAGVRGEAGIGKTSLLRHAAAPFDAVEGGGLAALGYVPYHVLSRAFREAAPTGDALAVAAWAVRALGDRLLVLDDLHWADAATLGLLPLLAPRVRLLVGVRTGDGGTVAALAAAEAAGIELLQLDGLAEREAWDLLRVARPGLDEEDARQIVAAAHGNPLFLEELETAGGVSPSLRLSLRARLSRCSPSAHEGLAVAGLLGRPADPALLPAADELLEAALVVHSGDGLVPRHPLLGEEAAADLTPEQRRILHVRLAAALDDPGEAARHLAAAGERARAYDSALLAAEQASRPGERALHLALAAENADGSRSAELRLEAAEALTVVGDADRALALAAGLAPGEASLVRAQAHRLAGRPAEARAQLAEGLGAAAGDSTLTLRLQVQALILRTTEPPDDANVAEARQAWLRSRRLGVETVRTRWLYGSFLYWFAYSRRSLPHLRAALAEARAGGDFALESEVALSLYGATQAFGLPDEAWLVATKTAGRARARALRGTEFLHRWAAARIDLFVRGATAAATRELERCLAEPALSYPSREQVTADTAVAHALAGRDARTQALLAEAPEPTDPWGRELLYWATVEAALLGGRPRDALAGAERLLELPQPRLELFARASRAWALFDLGEPVDEPVPRTSAHDPFGGLASEIEGLLALESGDAAVAERAFVRAARGWHGRLLWQELRAWHAASLARAALGDTAAARRRLLRVERRAQQAGWPPLVTRCERSLRGLGVRRVRSGARTSLLTGREADVLALVGEGLSTAEIARRLGIADSSVERVLRTAMDRLGARSRIQAAALAIDPP